MTTQTYAAWPFRSFTARSIDENERWWKACYLRGEASKILAGWPHWRIIVGGPGSGKSVALAEVERREAGESLIVRYPLERWPGERLAFSKDAQHLAQIMACVALAVRDYLTDAPDKLKLLTAGQCEFVRWLLDRFTGPRAFTRWIDGLLPEQTDSLQQVKYQDLYPTADDPRDVHGQIDEIINLGRRLGFHRLLVTFDLNAREAERHVDQLGQLFETLDLMQHRGLALLAALPADIIGKANFIERARGRASIVYLDWTLDQVRDIAGMHLCAATGQPAARLEDYATAALLETLEARLKNEFSSLAPQAWVMLAEALLYVTHRPDEPLLPPLKIEQVSDVLAAFFTRHIWLELSDSGVWRGPKFIYLDRQPWRFVQVLWTKSNTPISADDPDLGRVVRTKANAHKLANRVREKLEPVPDWPIYLLNDRGEGGYWLENITPTLKR